MKSDDYQPEKMPTPATHVSYNGGEPIMIKDGKFLDDIPCDNAHLDKLENAKRACQNDIEVVLEAIQQQMTEDDIKYLFTNPLIFGESLQKKVLDYIESVVEGEKL